MTAHTLKHLLKEYGLTKNQSKILATLTQHKKYLTVKQISQLSNLARESIYDILIDLKEKGLIEKKITTPKKYNAIPLKRTLQILHEQKTSQIHNLEILTKQALTNNNPKDYEIKEKNQYVLVPKKTQYLERINQAISNSKKIVKIKTSTKRYVQAINLHKKMYQESFTNAISNGVSFKIIIEKTSEEEKRPEEIKFLKKSSNISIKFSNTNPKIIMAIIDNKEVFLMNEPNSNLGESSALWSNNQSLILALSTCFDTFWKNLTP